MKLYELRDIIKDDLHIYNLETGDWYKNVDCQSIEFTGLSYFRVVSVRSAESTFGHHASGIVICVDKRHEDTTILEPLQAKDFSQ